MKTRCCYPKRYLLLFFSLLVSVGSILMSVSLSSCSSSVKSPLLLSADSLMEIYPDSALSILESISSPQKLPRADRALYALLLTQARHKNYIALGDDSLIKMAVEYYGDKKKSVRAAKAHYYWGATYLEKGYTSFAVDEYLTAIRLMPVRDEFLAMIYDNLADCYEKDDLYDIAIEAYRQAYQILEGGSQQTYPLRGIARICLLQNKKDSALLYYQKALDYALAEQDSSLIGALYHDLAMVYNEKKDYVQADKYVSKAMIMQGDDAVNVCLSKAQIMLNLNKLDSASYFFSKNIDQLNIYGKAVCYDGMHQIAKKRGEWKIATENMDAYRVLYDSMQIMNDNEELNRLMDKHQLEEHKRLLSEHTKMLVFTLVSVFFFLRWVLSIPFFISCIRQQNPLTVLSKIILRKVKQFNLPPQKKMRDFCIFEDTPRLFLLGNRQFTFIAHNLDVAEDVVGQICHRHIRLCPYNPYCPDNKAVHTLLFKTEYVLDKATGLGLAPVLSLLFFCQRMIPTAFLADYRIHAMLLHG